MKLSTLSILLGLVVVLVQLVALMRPRQFMAGARRFSRSLPWGYALMAAGTIGYFYFLRSESLSDFERYKNVMFLGFGLVAAAVCVYVSDFLAVRGLAVAMMVLAKLMVDTARWNDSEWRLVIVSWAYVMIVAGIWFTVSPWRCRDLIDWATATEQRHKALSLGRLAFGAVVLVLGLTVF